MNRVSAAMVPIVGVVALLGGCFNPAAPTSPTEEDRVRESFTTFQVALKDRDADRLWALLDAESQADADRAAQAEKAVYEKASAVGKAKQEKELGLSGAELAALTGRGFLKTNRFHGKYDEVPDGKLDKITVQGNSATVHYTESDGDKKTQALVRQEGQWKVTVPMPKGPNP
jgi:hypothetical protein